MADAAGVESGGDTGFEWWRAMYRAGHGNLHLEYKWQTTMSVPYRLKDDWVVAAKMSMTKVVDDPNEPAWAFLDHFLAGLILGCAARGGEANQVAIVKRMKSYIDGDIRRLWTDAITEAERRLSNLREAQATSGGRQPQPPEDVDARVNKPTPTQRKAIFLASKGEFSRAMAALEAPPLAPGTDATVQRLRELHPPSTDVISDEVRRLAKEYGANDVWEPAMVAAAIRSMPRNAAEDRGGWRSEHYAPFLGDNAALALFTKLLELWAKGEFHPSVATLYAGNRLQALLKPNGDIRPIGIPDARRRIAGKVQMMKISSDLAKHLVGADGKAVQFAVGRKGGAQMHATATREYLRLHPDHVVISIDIVNAYNSISRAKMMEAILRLPEELRHILSFVLQLYDGPIPLSFFDDLARRIVIDAEDGCTQGCTWAGAIFSIPLMEAMVKTVKEAVTRKEDVDALFFANDGEICGLPAHAFRAVHDLSTIHLPEIGCRVKHCVMLKGANVQNQDVSLRALQRAARVTGAPPGFVILEKGEMRAVGAAVGPDPSRVNVKETMSRHQKRSQHIRALGAVDKQVALLLLVYCTVSMPLYALQLTPLDLIRAEVDAATKLMQDVYLEILSIHPDEALHNYGVLQQMSFPHRLSGSGITDYAAIADAAMVGCYQSAASWLKANVPCLTSLGDANLSVDKQPLWGHLAPAFERLRAMGPAVSELLPGTAHELVTITETKLQAKLTTAIHQLRYDALHDELQRRGQQVDAARLTALTAPGATSWMTATPYDDRMRLSAFVLPIAHRLNLGLPLKELLEARRFGRPCHCCGLPTRCVFGHHILSQPRATSLGGRHHTHDSIQETVRWFAVENGLSVTTERRDLDSKLVKITARNPGGERLTPDILIRGLINQQGLGTMADVMVTHYATGNGEVKHISGIKETLVASGKGEASKYSHYAGIPEEAGYEFYPLVVETTGGFGIAFRAFLKRVIATIIRKKTSGIYTERVPGGGERDVLNGLMGGAVPVAQVNSRLYLRVQKQINVARIRSIAMRLIGGGIDTFCGLNGNGGGELNLGFDEDAALRECRGMSFDDNPPLQLFVEHADFLAG